MFALSVSEVSDVRRVIYNHLIADCGIDDDIEDYVENLSERDVAKFVEELFHFLKVKK